MLRKKNIYIYAVLTALFLSASVVAGAQETDYEAKAKALVEKGDSLRVLYRFDESLTVYRQALEAARQQEDFP